MGELYFDNNATTKVCPSVLDELNRVLEISYGNPSGTYKIAREAESLMNDARLSVSKFIGARSSGTVIFTSGATESNNAVINSCVKLFPQKRHIISTAVEHSSVREPLLKLKDAGYTVDLLHVDGKGRIDLDELRAKLTPQTLLASIMFVNNEIGNIYPIEDIRRICNEISTDILLHTDAVQAIGKIDVDVEKLGVDFLSLSGHKFHAPKGIGCLYIKNPTNFIPLLSGGNQEYGLRSGTENVQYIVAIGKAIEEISFEDNFRICTLRNRLEEALKRNFSELVIIGDKKNRVCSTTNILFPSIDGVILATALNEVGISVSSGSACSEKGKKQSHVLAAMGIKGKGIRISLSRFTTGEDVTRFLGLTIPVIGKLRPKG